jgi:hypothetical protein
MTLAALAACLGAGAALADPTMTLDQALPLPGADKVTVTATSTDNQVAYHYPCGAFGDIQTYGPFGSLDSNHSGDTSLTLTFSRPLDSFRLATEYADPPLNGATSSEFSITSDSAGISLAYAASGNGATAAGTGNDFLITPVTANTLQFAIDTNFNQTTVFVFDVIDTSGTGFSSLTLNQHLQFNGACFGIVQGQVHINAPGVTQTFSPASIEIGGKSVLTMTLVNDNDAPATLTAALVNTLPAGVVLADAAFGGTCGAAAVSGAAGGNTFTYAAQASIPPGRPGACTITANVTSASVGSYTDTIAGAALQTSNGGNSVAAPAGLKVTPPAIPISAPALAPAWLVVLGLLLAAFASRRLWRMEN